VTTALLTGGADFIGSHVVDHMIACGFEVLILTDLSGEFRENVNPAAELPPASASTSTPKRDVARTNHANHPRQPTRPPQLHGGLTAYALAQS
jgi:nucleoside-diphosphate-sugar epimerase